MLLLVAHPHLELDMTRAKTMSVALQFSDELLIDSEGSMCEAASRRSKLSSPWSSGARGRGPLHAGIFDVQAITVRP